MAAEEFWEGRQALREFARWVIRESREYELDGGEVQAKATELGLLRQEPYDPVRHPNVNPDFDVEMGDTIYVYTDLMK